MQRQEQAVLTENDRPYGFLAPPQARDELGRIDGYRVLRVLGEGGMGIVFEAHDPKLERKVAIKVVRPGEADASLQKRFMQKPGWRLRCRANRSSRFIRWGSSKAPPTWSWSC